MNPHPDQPTSIGAWPLSSGMTCTDPSVGTLNDTSLSWTCWRCGGVVPSGCVHSCPTGILPPLPHQPAPVAPAQVNWLNPYDWTLQRIATALERIAAALEKER